jgi:hypothetical protein
MGVFDQVFVECPNCKEKVEFQSKANKEGPGLEEFTLKSAPQEIITDIAGDQATCKKCKTRFILAKISDYELEPVVIGESK